MFKPEWMQKVVDRFENIERAYRVSATLQILQVTAEYAKPEDSIKFAKKFNELFFGTGYDRADLARALREYLEPINLPPHLKPLIGYLVEVITSVE